MSGSPQAAPIAASESSSDLPQSWGVVLYPGFDLLDVAGPMEYLNSLALHYPTRLSIIAKSLDPVSTEITRPDVLPGIGQRWLPTHTFADAPPLDALLVPGGYGSRIEGNQQEIGEFLNKTYPVRHSFASAKRHSYGSA
jgi:putative intracellular protease/amidase